MVTVTGFTAARMLEIEQSAIISGHISGTGLILVTRAGDEIDAGEVVGPTGPAGPTGGAVYEVGHEMTWPGLLARIPTDFVHEDGRQLLKSGYPVLYDIMGDSWNIGGEPSTHFRIPDSRNKVFVGAGGDYALGTYGGSNTHTLSVNEMPQHNHTLTDPGHLHDIPDTLVNVAAGIYPIYVLGGSSSFAGGAVRQYTGMSVNNKGGGLPHNNMQAFGAKYVILKVQ